MSHKGEEENGSHYNKGGGATKNVFSKKDKGKKRTSYVNDNGWWDKLAKGFKNLGSSYEPQKLVRLGQRPKHNTQFAMEKMSEFMFVGLREPAQKIKDTWNARKKQNSDNASKY